MDERRRAVLDTLDDVVRDAGRARVAAEDHAEPFADHPWLAAVEAEPFAPPPPDGVEPSDLQALTRAGLVVRTGSVWFAASAIETAAARVADLLATRPEGVTVAEVREALGTSRKYVIPLLTHFDETGRTRRRGDHRIAGPRLAVGR
nr:SelB C-terminal domain-containing protein [Rhabdothermincola salaria]